MIKLILYKAASDSRMKVCCLEAVLFDFKKEKEKAYMGDSSGSMFYGVIGFLVVYFVGYFICRVYDKIKKILRSHSSKSQRREDDSV